MSLELPGFFYFDIGNVLVDFDVDIAVRNVARLSGRDLEQIRSVQSSKQLAEGWDRGAVSNQALCQAWCEALDVNFDLAALLEALSDIFQPRPAAFSVVRSLHQAGFRLGLLSNTCDPHWRHLQNSVFDGLDSLFGVRVLSFEQGCLKPEPSIYRIAAERAGLPLARIFFVDDRIENVRGASEAGFDAVLFTSMTQLRADLAARGVDVPTPSE